MVLSKKVLKMIVEKGLMFQWLKNSGYIPLMLTSLAIWHIAHGPQKARVQQSSTMLPY
jgi:hypothetical protein